MSQLQSLKLVALDIDGVLLPDSFSPVIFKMVTDRGFEYTRDIEYNVFSQPRKSAAEFLINRLQLNISAENLIAEYFHERKQYLMQAPLKPAIGLEYFLKMLRKFNLKIIAYGGLEADHFYKELAGYTQYFDDEKYICTNLFRPGIMEISSGIYNFKCNQVLFIDDVARVAEEAKKLNIPFIGIPSSFIFGYQKNDMIDIGVKYLVHSIGEIDEEYILRIDHAALISTVWS